MRKFVPVAALFSLLCCANAIAAENVDLLRLIAHGYKTNFEKIHTWQGECEIVSEYGVNDGDLKRYEKSTAQFMHDVNTNSTRWYWTTVERINEDGNSVIETPLFESGIITYTTMYKLHPVPLVPSRPPTNVDITWCSLDQSRARIGGRQGVFHPIYYFKSIDRDWHSRLMFFYENAKAPEMSDVKIMRKGDIVILEVGGGSEIINYHEFDISQGYNIVKFNARDPIIDELWGFEYEAIDGVFIPKTVRYINRRAGSSGTIERTISFNRNILNEPISQKEFAIEKLRLKPNDLIRNTVIGTSWRYKQKQGDVLKIVGTVVDEDGDAVQGAHVYVHSPGSPYGSFAVTDGDGKFSLDAVEEGALQISASHRIKDDYFHTDVQIGEGTQDIILVLLSQGADRRFVSRQPASLIGKALPDLSGYGIELDGQASPVLVCVWEWQQRPSRHMVQQLAERADELAGQSVHVVLLNGESTDREPLEASLNDFDIPFPCGVINIDPDNARFNLGVRAMPWLILTDADRTVVAEGFDLSRLNETLSNMN